MIIIKVLAWEGFLTVESPSKEHGSKGIASHRSKEGCHVLDVWPVGCSKDNVCHSCEGSMGRAEEATPVRLVAEPAGEDTPQCASNIGRDCHELSMRGCPSEGLQEGGKEQCERLRADVDESESAGTNDGVDVEDSPDNVGSVSLVNRVVERLAVDTLDGDVLLTRGQEAARYR